MKIGIISDTHGCHERFFTCFLINILKDADMIIHAGDVFISWTKKSYAFRL